MWAGGRIANLPRETVSGYCLPRQVPSRDMTDSPQGRKEKFFAVVLPRLHAAGYGPHGSQARLAQKTGMSTGTASRLMRGLTIPDIPVFPALAKIIDMSPLELLVLAGHLPREVLQPQETLSETKRSQVGSEGLTPESVADGLGFHDEMRRAIFLGVVESLKTATPDTQEDDSNPGGEAAQI